MREAMTVQFVEIKGQIDVRSIIIRDLAIFEIFGGFEIWDVFPETNFHAGRKLKKRFLRAIRTCHGEDMRHVNIFVREAHNRRLS